jgi:hypothetical protein
MTQGGDNTYLPLPLSILIGGVLRNFSPLHSSNRGHQGVYSGVLLPFSPSPSSPFKRSHVWFHTVSPPLFQ